MQMPKTIISVLQNYEKSHRTWYFDTTESENVNILKLIEPLLKVYLMDDCGYFDKFYVDCVKHF